MSRQPSPGLPHSAMYHQLPPAVSSSKQKTKGHVPGITAGAEDVKYQAKYRELKKKVKEIEFDNDKLYLKLLVAKKNIRRMNLERAILYERLAAVPPTPGRSPQELPQEQDPLFAGPPVVPPDVPRPPANDRELDEYMRQHPNARVIQAADGRIIDIEDGSGRAGALGLSAPSDAPPYRREPTARYEGDRQPQVHGGPVPQIREPQPERAELPPDAHRPSRSSSAYSNHHRSRSSTARQDVDVQGEPRIEPLQPAHTVHSRSASIPDEPRRRHEHHNPPPPLERVERSPSHSPVHSPSHNRSLHNHQRIGPGVHLHRSVIDMDPEERAKLLAERRKEEEREKEREVRLRERLAMEAMEEEELRNGGTWPQEDAYMAGPPRGRSRSDTPVSGGVTRESSRPPADPYRGHTHPHTHSHHYERDAYYERRDDRLPVDAPAYAPEYRESRKRTRQEMEVDDDREMRSPLERTRSAGSGGGPAEAFPVSQELRGPRRGPSEEPDVPRVHTSSIRDEKPMDQDD